MSDIYNKFDIWLTIDVEEILDTNFNINWKSKPDVNYEKLLDNWLELNTSIGYKSTCFVLGSFAQKYPNLIKKLSKAGHEIASHGMNHNLVNKIEFKQWQKSLIQSKKLLEDLTGKKVDGYRSASWSLPFNKRYYEELVINGYKYSSSYFPLKTYMYGNIIDKKQPFVISTNSGEILEIPIAKYKIPFSGGFYLRTIPIIIEQYLANKLISKSYKPIIYIHPYELMDENLMLYFKKYATINIDFLLAFFSSSLPRKKIIKIINTCN